jgi:creatinine amidohydrolase
MSTTLSIIMNWSTNKPIYLSIQNSMTKKNKLHEMTRPEVETALASGIDTAVATFGATEQHGLHLPLATDFLWGEEIGFRVAKELGNAVQIPGLRIGCSEHHMDFAGSLTLSLDTFIAVVSDTCHSLARHGFKNIVLLPTHGGNFNPIGKAAQQIRPQLPHTNIIAYSNLMPFMDAMFAVAKQYGFSPAHTGAHAGENETSMILALRPDLVHMDKAEAGYVGDHLALADSIMRDGFKGVTKNGVLGDPTGARADIGEAYLQAITNLFVAYVGQNRL